jgi:hypothetical protein
MRNIVACAGLCLGLVATVSLTAPAAEPTAAELFPVSTIVYGELRAPAKVLHSVLDHPLSKEIVALPEYRQAQERPAWRQWEATVSAFEAKLELPWREAVPALTGGGVYVGVDLATQGVIVLAQASEEKLAKKARDALLELVRAEAAAKGRANPVQEEELGGARVFTVDKLHLAVMGKWLLVTNKRLAAFMVLENFRGTGSGSLAGNAHFQAVREKRAGQESLWVYADLRALQQLGALSKLAGKKGNNPLLELVLGGVVGLLPRASYATAAVETRASSVKLTATLPGDPAGVGKPRTYYFDAAGEGGAPPLLQPEGTLLSLATYRDLGLLWRSGPDLFDDRVNARMAQAESQLTTFFAGRDFRDDILGNLHPQIQLVVARRDFTGQRLAPAIKLPAVGVVMRLKNPETTTRVFKVTFQSLIGFLNVVGGMKKVDPLELRTETLGDAVVVSTEHLAAPESEAAAGRGEGPIHFNVSPTAVFSGEQFILASAKPLALALLEASQSASAAAEQLNSHVVVDGKVIQAALADNREPLVAQNVLTKGHDRPAAEKEIDRLLGLVSHFERLSLKLNAANKQLHLTVEAVLTQAP